MTRFSYSTIKKTEKDIAKLQWPAKTEVVKIMGCENTYLVKHKDSTTLPVPQGVNKQTKIPEAWRLEPSFPKYVSLISPLLCMQAWLGRGMSERDFSCCGLLNCEQHIHLRSAFITSFSSVNKFCDCESSSKLFLVQQNINLVAPTFPEIYTLATLFPPW